MYKPIGLLTLFLCFSSALHATENYYAGARATGLSNSFVSISDSWSTFHNQATLSSLTTFSAGIFYESRFNIDELSLLAGTLVTPSKVGTFGLSLYQFGKGDFKEHKLGLAYALRLSERLSAALQLDYFSKCLPENSDSYSFATFEFGLTHRTTKNLTLAFHTFNPVKNGFDTPFGKQKMAARYRFGGHYSFSELALISSEIEYHSEKKETWRAGLEFSPTKKLYLRCGVSGQPLQYSLGLGYQVKKVRSDITFGYHGYLGFTPSISINFSL